MVDYKRFAVILLCLSVFLYMGTLISLYEGNNNIATMTLFTIVLLITSASFFRLSISYKKKCQSEDEM